MRCTAWQNGHGTHSQTWLANEALRWGHYNKVPRRSGARDLERNQDEDMRQSHANRGRFEATPNLVAEKTQLK
jgi:hypothetical protein